MDMLKPRMGAVCRKAAATAESAVKSPAPLDGSNHANTAATIP
eukprot:CAMPEP_0113612424 /NCGR_PEP_ID=MMETSP0017_2-20120614/6094_1 /TAXON_ID=2856 /ORGANISM="Cylindrotheca closterium" /LENGTH=42 /DNA_ID=CAMNT_0000521461 /DNA_START=51 /DNA_END=176 /DNA_ORIENTATION=+ /assembly_acc=CAM_ASM_000147